MPISTGLPVAPAGTTLTGPITADTAALFGALLSGLAFGGDVGADVSADAGGDAGEDASDDTDSGPTREETTAAAPLPTALLVGLNLPIGDAPRAVAQTAAGATPTPAPAPAPAPGPTSTSATVPAPAQPVAQTPVYTVDDEARPPVPEPVTVAPKVSALDAAFVPAPPQLRADGVAPTAPVAPNPGPPQLTPAAQLALRLAPLRTGPDGTHQMTIHLNPDELGPITVVAQVKGDRLAVQLTGGTQAGREAMTAALPQLEQDLRDSGFTTLAVNVRQAPQPDPVERPAWAGGPGATGTGAGTATDKTTNGTGPTTFGAKTDSQPIGQATRPDGIAMNRRDDVTGQYNAAGQTVTAPGQAMAAPPTSTGQQANQMSTGQHGHQPSNPGNADQSTGGRNDGTGHGGGSDRQTGQAGDREPRTAEHRPPADATQFLTQTAQFTMVEKLEDLSKYQQEMITAQLMTGATNMIGRTITYTGLDGKEASGVVKSATIGSNPTLKVGNTDVALSSVKEVRPTTTP
jgi:hypothetical protein